MFHVYHLNKRILPAPMHFCSVSTKKPSTIPRTTGMSRSNLRLLCNNLFVNILSRLRHGSSYFMVDNNNRFPYCMIVYTRCCELKCSRIREYKWKCRTNSPCHYVYHFLITSSNTYPHRILIFIVSTKSTNNG